jgi:hypothetical protein
VNLWPVATASGSDRATLIGSAWFKTQLYWSNDDSQCESLAGRYPSGSDRAALIGYRLFVQRQLTAY